MVAIESTPQMCGRVYESMVLNLAVVRRRLQRPLTLSEKVVLGHLYDPVRQDLVAAGSYLRLRPDRVVFQDVLGQTGLLQFMQTRREKVAIPTTIHCDHLIRAHHGSEDDLREALGENAEVYEFLRSAAQKYGAGFWEPGGGIIHQVVLENYAFPGALILGTDSHTPNAGGLGACAIGVGGADAVEAIAGLPWEVMYPKRIAVYLTGRLSGWTAPKDVILHIAGVMTVTGGTNAIIEYIGPGARTISATGKATIANMGAELGATTSIFPFDEHIATYLRATGREDHVSIVEQYRNLLEPDPQVEGDPMRYYDRVIELDLSALEPHVVGPHSPDRARPISLFGAELRDPENGFVDQLSAALIGSCTNSSYEDMSRAADVAAQAIAYGLKSSVPFLISPGSEQVRATLERDGQIAYLKSINGIILANACGPCIGQWHSSGKGRTAPNTIVTSYNRNFPGRNDGRPTTMNFIASPELVTAWAIAGRLSFNPLTDTLTSAHGQTFRLESPKPASEVPPRGFERDKTGYVAPPDDGRHVELKLKSASERIQLMEPWPAWDGRDYVDMPVLIKTRGKTTTDHISPAGPWLRFRGHLDRFSDNMFLGAINAFTGEAGKTKNVLTGKCGVAIAETARYYRAKSVKWIVVGDNNYGEGSSREHAALSLRLLGGVAVIARSFARIHASNLKKQGLLAFTFQDPADYDRIREDDRISLLGLSGIAPHHAITCLILHASGTSETLQLNHTFSTTQIEWFRAGSALNTSHKATKRV